MNKTNECGGTVCSYERLLLSVYASRPLTEVLKMISHIAVLFSVFVYGVRVATVDLWGAVRFIVLTAIPCLAVTLLRRLIDAPRPYELIAFYAPAPPKKKKDKGFPSRHVFSLFLITVMSFPVLPILSSVLLILGIALGGAYYKWNPINNLAIFAVTYFIALTLALAIFMSKKLIKNVKEDE